MTLPLQDAWNERNKLIEKADELCEAAKSSRDEAYKLRVEADKLSTEAYKLRVEADKLSVEAYKLSVEAATIWTSAIFEKYGEVSVGYTKAGCILANGDVYRKPEEK